MVQTNAHSYALIFCNGICALEIQIVFHAINAVQWIGLKWHLILAIPFVQEEGILANDCMDVPSGSRHIISNRSL